MGKGTSKMVCNGDELEFHPSNNWRKSLVPAPAVIPAPRVYFKVVAVKTLVVYLREYDYLFSLLFTYSFIFNGIDKGYLYLEKGL